MNKIVLLLILLIFFCQCIKSMDDDFGHPEQNFFNACANGHLEKINIFINLGVNINLQNEFGQTGLMLLLKNNLSELTSEKFYEIFRLLLKSANQKDFDGRTALYFAADIHYKFQGMRYELERRIEIIKILLACGADPMYNETNLVFEFCRKIIIGFFSIYLTEIISSRSFNNEVKEIAKNFLMRFGNFKYDNFCDFKNNWQKIKKFYKDIKEVYRKTQFDPGQAEPIEDINGYRLINLRPNKIFDDKGFIKQINSLVSSYEKVYIQQKTQMNENLKDSLTNVILNDLIKIVDEYVI